MSANADLTPVSQTIVSTGLQQKLEKIRVKRPEMLATRAKLRLVQAAQVIRDEDPETRPALFLSAFLIQCTLPHSDPGDVPVWTRTNNEYTLAIQPGWDIRNNRSLGLPWGRLPRLLLIWIVTEAKRTGCRRLELGNSLTEFLRKLNLDPSRGGKRDNRVRIKEAARRLFGCNIIFYKRLGVGAITGESVKESKVAPERELWWDASPHDQAMLWGSWIELGHDFFAEIMKSTVPFNMRAIQELRSPLALDLYLLCNWLGANLAERGKTEHFLSWGMLAKQIGGDYADLNNLKKKITKPGKRADGNVSAAILAQIKLVHPDLRVTQGTRWIGRTQQGGLIVKPSAPAIPRRRAIG